MRQPRSLPFALLLLLFCTGEFITNAQSQQRASFFEQRVAPILRTHCLSCHGTGKMSGLDMRTATAFQKGGTHGAALVAGSPTKSRLFRYVSGLEKTQMPPSKRLSSSEIAILREWIQEGGNWTASFTLQENLPWAFRKPLRYSLPKVQSRSWVQNPIDAFVLAKLEAKHLQPGSPADRKTLLRRVTFDLIGLPPTPEEVEAFVHDSSTDAYEKVVSRLLASPHYGERWARHWLDLARYAESEGFKSDEIRPNAWRYRDYVINSLNSDKPYSRFLQEQIAGDELFPNNPEALIATAFNRNGPDESNATDLSQRRQEILNDITDTIGSSILGLTIGCARCHNHKYDPISQKDYYRLQAFFAPARLENEVPAFTLEQQATYQKQMRTWKEKTQEARTALAKLEAPYREKFFLTRKKRFAPDVQMAIETAPDKRTPLQWILYHKGMPQLDMGAMDAKTMRPTEQKEWHKWKEKLDAFASLKPAAMTTPCITDIGADAPKTFLLAGGSYTSPREEVAPGYLSLLASEPATIRPVKPNSTGRRAALAQWLISPENPLTARVMVNRVWQHHFGVGLVGTPDDFGVMGQKPTHPELLDWLTTEFVRNGWSLKQLHRLIVTSNTYRQATTFQERASRIDPENHLLWSFRRQRLEGEPLRDAMLAISGELNPKMGGASVFPELPTGITTRGNWQDTKDPQERTRRSIYVFVKRNLRYPLFATFDMPDTHESCGRRVITTTASQALFLLNDVFVLHTAKVFAERLVKEAGSSKEAEIDHAYRLVFARPPDKGEKKNALAFLERQSQQADEKTALLDFCHALLNASEFVYTE